MPESKDKTTGFGSDEASKLASLLDVNKREDAISFIEQCLSATAGSARFMPVFIDTLRSHGSRTTALICVNTARKTFPKNIDLRLFRADLLIRMGKLEAAQVALEGLSSEAHRPVYRQHMLTLAVALDQVENSEHCLDEADDFANRDSLVFRHAEIKALMAQEAYEAATEKSIQALKAYSGASRLHVQHVRLVLARDGARAALPLAQTVAARFKNARHAQLVLADCLRAAGQRPLALKQLDATARQFPQSALPWIRMARINLDLGYRQVALSNIQTARALDAGTVPVELAYTDVLIKLGRREDAVARLKWLVENQQVTPAILVKLINCLSELRQFSAAQDYVDLAQEKFPDSAAVLENLALQAKKSGSVIAAQKPLTDLARQVPKSRFDGLSAQIALDALDTDAALLAPRKIPATRREPHDVGFIARTLIVQGKTELVWRYLRFCLHYWPCEPALVSFFAQSANKIGRQRETIAALAAMEEETGAHTPEILSNLVLLHAAIGESDAAFVAFRSCLSQGGFPQQNAYRMLLRCMIGDGRGAKLALLIEEQEASGLWKTPHPQKTYHGQLITEVKIALASGVDGPLQKVGPRDRSGHVALMRDHPDSNVTAMRTMRHWLLFGPHSSLETANSIPRQIAQYWDAETPPARIASMMDTWRTQPNFGYQRFDRHTATAYLRAHFGALTVNAFRLARNPAEEADFFRLCFLAHEGGVYADADDRLIGDLNTVLSGGAEFIALLEPGFANLGNNFIAAAANHPVLMDAVECAQAALLSRAAETTWSKTGPGLLTRALANELTRGPKENAGAGICLLSLADISGIVAIHNAAEHKNAASDWRLT